MPQAAVSFGSKKKKKAKKRRCMHKCYRGHLKVIGEGLSFPRRFMTLLTVPTFALTHQDSHIHTCKNRLSLLLLCLLRLHPSKMSTNSSSATQLQREVLLNGPALQPPAGILPDFQKPAGLETVLWVTNVLSFTLPSAALLLRIYTKHFLLHSIGYDDCKF